MKINIPIVVIEINRTLETIYNHLRLKYYVILVKFNCMISFTITDIENNVNGGL